MRTLGILGGSFNPIHNGHLYMARRAAEAFALETVLMMPTGNPPHKREGLAGKEDRLRMVQLAVQNEPHLCACDVEMRRDGVIYTVDTLNILHAQMPDTRFLYLIGADTLLDIPNWRKIDEVLTLCGFIVCTRPGYEEGKVDQCKNIMRQRGADIISLPMEKQDISSTDIRARVREGKTLRGYVPPEVEAYIRQRGLYQSR